MTTTSKKYMTKKEWLAQRDMYNEFGNPMRNSLVDLPIQIMSRYDAFKKQGASDAKINEYYKTKPESLLIKYRGSI